MTNLLVLLVAAAYAAGGVQCDLQHSARIRSICTARDECSQYLAPDSSGECQARCQGLVNRVWNDTVRLITNNIFIYYTPDSDDKCFLNRTLRCLARDTASIPTNEKCLIANRSLDCYNNQFGKLNISQPEYIKLSKLRISRLWAECADILQVPDDKRKALAQYGVDTIPEGACLLRCTLQRMALYDDDKGMNLRRLYTQCGKYDNPPHVIQQCIDKVKAEECDKCKRVGRIAKECLQMYYVVRDTSSTGPAPYEVVLRGQYDTCNACPCYCGRGCCYATDEYEYGFRDIANYYYDTSYYYKETHKYPVSHR